jgi:hypothetical protein
LIRYWRECLTVGDANGLDAVDRVSILLESLNSALNAVVYGRNNFLGIVFVPSRLRVDLGEFLIRSQLHMLKLKETATERILLGEMRLALQPC